MQKNKRISITMATTADSQPKETLHQFARDEDIAALEKLMEVMGAKETQRHIDELDKARLSPLHYAARNGDCGMLKLLVDANADVNVRGDKGMTPLHLAARHRCQNNQMQESSSPPSVVQLLVSRGAQVEQKDEHGLMPLHHAAITGNSRAVHDLLHCDGGINVETRDAEDTTPLHLVAINGSADIAKMLADAGASLRPRDLTETTPLLRAAAEGHLGVAMVLVEASKFRGGFLAVSELVADTDVAHNTALHLATGNGHRDVVQFLVSNGADVDARNDRGNSPFHLAAAANDKVEIVRTLLDKGGNVNCRNANRRTPLHSAAQFNRVNVIELLCSHGADVEAKDVDGVTPLLVAADRGYVEAVRSLLNRGADPTTHDTNECTSIFAAVRHNHHGVLLALLEDPRSQCLLNRTDRSGNSLLHEAAANGFLAITQRLVELGCPTELRDDDDGWTALHLASANGFLGIVRHLVVKGKASVNGKDDAGNTPLHLAAFAGHERVVEALLEAGANVNVRNELRWTPLDCAASAGHADCVKLLLDAGGSCFDIGSSTTSSLHLAASTGNAQVVLLLLEWGADVSQPDHLGRNCLEVAIEHSRKDIAKMIVCSRFWKLALQCHRFTADGVRVTPLRLLIQKMPDVAEDVFDRCSETNDLPLEHPMYTVTFHYDFLDDHFLSADHHDTPATNHPLMIMARSRHQKLLAHPLCASLIYLKWIRFGRHVYYANLSLYLLFLIFLTTYVLSLPPPLTKDDGDTNLNESLPASYVDLCDLVREEVTKRTDALSTSVRITRQLVVFLVVLHIMKELFQLYMLRLSYFRFENLMEWSCYLASLLLTIDFSKCSAETGIRERWQWQVGAAAIFLAWINLILFVSKFPHFGLYVVMFSDVCRTFCKVGAAFFFIFVAFALSYHTVLYYEEAFNSAAKAIVRIAVMMLMEFQFDDLYHDNTLLYPVPAYILFVLLLVVVSLVIMNLLVGLSVDEIKSIRAQAHVRRLALQVELVLSVEAVLPRMLQERFVIHQHSFVRHHHRRTNFIRRLLAKIEDNDALFSLQGQMLQAKNGHCPEGDTLQSLMAVVKDLQSDNKRHQDMLASILRLKGVHCEEEDDVELPHTKGNYFPHTY